MFSYMQTDKRECKRHGEYESVFMNIGEGRWTGCPTCAIERKQAEDEVAINRFHDERLMARINYGIRMARIPLRMGNESFDSFTIELGDGENAQQIVDAKLNAKELFISFAERVVNGSTDGQCLVAIGPAGTGKTHLSCAVIRHVVANSKKQCRYVSADEIVSRVFATYGSNSQSSDAEVISEFSSVDLLVIDENVSAANSDAKQNVIFSIMNNRYNACLPTILIGNLSVHELKDTFGERLYDRLRQIGKSVSMNWESHRGQV